MKRIIRDQNRLIILVLAISTFVLFGFISPSIKAQVSKSSTLCTAVGHPDPSANPCKQPISPTDFVFYCQADPKWHNACDIWYAGCGPSSLAMVASTFGVPVTPTEMDQAFRESGARVCGDVGSSLPTFFNSNWLQNHGLDGSSRVAHGPANTWSHPHSDLHILVPVMAGAPIPMEKLTMCLLFPK
jgi:hypothetical protein